MLPSKPPLLFYPPLLCREGKYPPTPQPQYHSPSPIEGPIIHRDPRYQGCTANNGGYLAIRPQPYGTAQISNTCVFDHPQKPLYDFSNFYQACQVMNVDERFRIAGNMDTVQLKLSIHPN